VRLTPKDVSQLRRVERGQPWAGMATWNPFWIFENLARRPELGQVGFTRLMRTAAIGNGA
jgi:hypothetical protein